MQDRVGRLRLAGERRAHNADDLLVADQAPRDTGSVGRAALRVELLHRDAVRAVLVVELIDRKLEALLAALDRYPFGCSEQITSRALPLLYVNDLAGAEHLALDGTVDQRIRDSIDRLLARQNGHASKAQVQRFKGLGEMNPSTLKETTLDPRTRTLLRITIDDAEKTEASIQTLMGKDVQPRFEFIMNRAPKVEEIDV